MTGTNMNLFDISYQHENINVSNGNVKEKSKPNDKSSFFSLFIGCFLC